MDADELAVLSAELVATAGDAIIFVDRSGTIVLWNSGAEAIFGYRADEAVGESLDLIIPERLRARHWDGYLETMRTGHTSDAQRVLAVPGVRRDGQTISIEFRVSLLPTATGDQPGAIAAIIRDVTERWNNDKELRSRLRTFEQRAANGSSG